MSLSNVKKITNFLFLSFIFSFFFSCSSGAGDRLSALDEWKKAHSIDANSSSRSVEKIDDIDNDDSTSGSYLKFESDKEFSITSSHTMYDIEKKWDGTLYYTADPTYAWFEWDGQKIKAVNDNGKYRLYLRGLNNTKISDGFNWIIDWKVGTNVYCEGDIRTLLNYEDVENTTMDKNCFSYMFYGCESLASAPSLPSLELSEGCYSHMFENCLSLTQAPSLPATTLAPYCYSYMFENCESLIQAPELIATSLAESCYERMFGFCLSLTSSPSLPAITLAKGCYMGMFRECLDIALVSPIAATTLADDCCKYMFSDCIRLTKAPFLPATTLAKGCYYGMFSGCSALEEAPLLPATILADDCYNSMFTCCGSLKNAPELPATNLKKNCYRSMFSSCVSLASIPAIPASSVPEGALVDMFKTCTSLRLSSSIDELNGYCTEYIIPSNLESGAGENMFAATCGSFKGSVEQSQKLWTKNDVVYLKNTAPTALKLEDNYELNKNTKNLQIVPVTTPWYANHNGIYYTIGDYNIVSISDKGILSAKKVGSTTLTVSTANGLSYKSSVVVKEIKALLFESDKEFSITSCIGDGGISWDGKLYYSDSSQDNWSEWNGKTIKSKWDGEKYILYIRGLGNTIISPSVIYGWKISGSNVSCSGDIRSLLNYKNPEDSKMAPRCFEGLFNYQTALISAPELPALELSERCYNMMFRGTSITSAPALPATVMKDNSYEYMFMDCKKLQSAPYLPAETLAYDCYGHMFAHCKELKKAPDILPAKYTADYCYEGMFRDCPNLVNPPAIAAVSSSKHCFEYMFESCKSLTSAPIINVNKLADSCCAYMFSGCTSLKLSYRYDGQGGYIYKYIIPENSDSNITSPVKNMFYGCYSNKGTTVADIGNKTWKQLTDDPKVGQTIYMQNLPVTQNPEEGQSVPQEETGDPAKAKFYFINSESNTWQKIELKLSSSQKLGDIKDNLPVTKRYLGQNDKSAVFEGWVSKTNKPADFSDDAMDVSRGEKNVNMLNDDFVLDPTGSYYAVYSSNCITMKSPNPFVFSIVKKYESDSGAPDKRYNDLKYSVDGVNWTDIEVLENYNSGEISGNNYLLIRGLGNKTISGISGIPGKFSIVGENVDCYGTLDSILDYKKVARGEDPEVGNSAFMSLFADCKALVGAPDISKGPQGENCCDSIFSGCTNLKRAPKIPSVSLIGNCYKSMFSGCTSLEEPPLELPATSLEDACYERMFYGCTSLKRPPKIMGTITDARSFREMFSGCKNLEALPRLLLEKKNSYNQGIVPGYYSGACYRMFYGCEKIKLYATRPESGTYNEFSVTADIGDDEEMFVGTGGDYKAGPKNGVIYYTPNEIV